ncbi:MAG: hypothetical protein M3Q08_00420 [Pseudomonadota bacterium]|nr:hypothetical protein [Pseudomonadota bacterium]
MINKRAAEKLVRHLQTVLRPADIAMEAAWLHGVPNYAVFPFPVMEEGESSKSRNHRYAAAPKPFPLKLRRGVARLLEGGTQICLAAAEAAWPVSCLRGCLGAIYGLGALA